VQKAGTEKLEKQKLERLKYSIN